MRILVIGDTHGNTDFLTGYLYPVAKHLRCDALLQLGDYGFWEHEDDGIDFNDDVAAAALRFGIPLYFLRGNHDNLLLLLELYGNRVTADGFISIRPNLFHIPDGLRFDWGGVSFRAFGGAYSIDKPELLEDEHRAEHKQRQSNAARRAAGQPERAYPSTAGTRWFPEEELTDEQMTGLLTADSDPVDVILSHDKPRGSTPHESWTDLLECLPNQDRLGRALTTHTPRLWLHGHLHLAYTDQVRASGDRWTTVTGLSCDKRGAGRFWRPTDAWAVLDTDPLQLTPGGTDPVSYEDVNAAVLASLRGQPGRTRRSRR